MALGHEDSREWKNKYPVSRDGRHCIICKEQIALFHCDAGGCGYCRSCGEKGKQSA